MLIPGLEKLSENERLVLMMLAEGHTAKSIANSTGDSIAAINERLREARRKTGFGSSRELARILAQENRPENLGVALAGQDPSSVFSSPVAKIGGIGWKGLIMMALVTSAAIATMMIGTPSAERQFFEDQPSPKELLAQLRSEPQDPRWTHIAEQEIRAHYETVDHFRVNKVVCATSICEIMGDDSGAILALPGK